MEKPVGAKLRIEYDADGDVLHLFSVAPYVEQCSDELEEGIIGRMNPTSGEVEALEVLFFTSRFGEGVRAIGLPVSAAMRRMKDTWQR